MTQDLVAESVTGPVTQGSGDAPVAPRRVVQPPVVVFGLVLLFAFVFYLVLARRLWFYRDDWEFLAGRTLSLDDLLRQHGGHMTALHLVVYRAMFAVIGLRSYLPYQVLSIGLHLLAATLLFVVMRKSSVNAWIAVAAASLFALFGAGGQDILWGFQIEFSGALVLGMTQMLLASHDGPIDRRDWAGLGVGLAALLCSGVAVAMVGVVGIATLIRRGWRPAAFHVLPLAALFIAWWSHYGLRPKSRDDQLSAMIDWVRHGTAGVFDALGQVPFVGWLLAAMLVVGMVLAWRDGPWAERRRRLAMPTAMLVGALGFEVVTAVNRSAFGARFATSSRYLHIVAALLIPSLAVAGNALFEKRRWLGPVVVALFVVGMPANLGKTTESFPPSQYFASYERMVRSLPRMELASKVPRAVRPELVNGYWMTVGWLLDNADAGRIPAPNRPPTAAERVTYRLRLGLQQIDVAHGTACQPLRAPIERKFQKGDAVVVRGAVRVRLVDDVTGLHSIPVSYGSSFLVPNPEHELRAVVPMTLELSGGTPNAQLCRVATGGADQ
jgi:hypothetical protein